MPAGPTPVASSRTPRHRASTAKAPERHRPARRPAGTVQRPPRIARSPRGREQSARPRDAGHRRPPHQSRRVRSHGSRVGGLCDAIRPHSALGWQPPAPAVQIADPGPWPTSSSANRVATEAIAHRHRSRIRHRGPAVAEHMVARQPGAVGSVPRGPRSRRRSSATARSVPTRWLLPQSGRTRRGASSSPLAAPRIAPGGGGGDPGGLPKGSGATPRQTCAGSRRKFASVPSAAPGRRRANPALEGIRRTYAPWRPPMDPGQLAVCHANHWPTVKQRRVKHRSITRGWAAAPRTLRPGGTRASGPPRIFEAR